MRILLIGGSKSGKSTAAQRLRRHLAAGAPLYYWATMTPRDSEDHQRILRHIADREGWGFRPIERSTGLTAALPDIDKRGAVLLDIGGAGPVRFEKAEVALVRLRVEF